MKRLSLIAVAYLFLPYACFLTYPETRYDEVGMLRGGKGLKIVQPYATMGSMSFARGGPDMWGLLRGERRQKAYPYGTYLQRKFLHLGVFDGRMRLLKGPVSVYAGSGSGSPERGMGENIFATPHGFLMVYVAGNRVYHCEYDLRSGVILHRREFYDLGSDGPFTVRNILHHDADVYLLLEKDRSVSIARANVLTGAAGTIRGLAPEGKGPVAFADAHVDGAGIYAAVRYEGDDFFYLSSGPAGASSLRAVKVPLGMPGGYGPSGGVLRGSFHAAPGGPVLIFTNGGTVWRKKLVSGGALLEQVYSTGGDKNAHIDSITCSPRGCYALVSRHSTGKSFIYSFTRGTISNVTDLMPIGIHCIGDKCVYQNAGGEISFLPDEAL